jgi:hypothetical protein
LAVFAVYTASNPVHLNVYNHFVWQADAFLHGRPWFPYPIPGGSGLPPNWYFQDVYPLTDASGIPDGRALLPFPPLPAIVLLPFVAVFGLFTDQQGIALVLAAVGVALAWWMVGRLPVSGGVRALTSLLFATGTAWWWAAASGSTWYFAHIVAADVGLLAVGIALGADPGAIAADPATEDTNGASAAEAAAERSRLARAWRSAWPPDRSQVLAGFLLGLATTARLPLLLAAPFLVFVGGGGSRSRRALSAALGGVWPVGALFLYTFLTTGSLVHPGYAYQYQLEVRGYPTLGYHADWSVEDVRYIPQNLAIMLGALPEVSPAVMPDTLGLGAPKQLCTTAGVQRSLFDPGCPLAVPVDIGTSVLLSAPGLLLALFAFRQRSLSRLATGTALAVALVATFNLSHFSQGWVQWGYRFSLDWIPFLLPMVALGAAAVNGRPRATAIVLLIVGAAVNEWGVTWGRILGW